MRYVFQRGAGEVCSKKNLCNEKDSSQVFKLGQGLVLVNKQRLFRQVQVSQILK